MKKFLKKYRHLAALLAVVVMAVGLFELGTGFGRPPGQATAVCATAVQGATG